MGFFKTAFGLSLRRLVRRGWTLGCLLLLPVLVLAMGALLPPAGTGQEAPVQVGVYVPAASARAQEVWQRLAGYSVTGLDIRRAASPEEVERRVAAGEWECGYLLPETLDEAVRANALDGVITRVNAPSAAMGNFADWAVTAALMEVCTPGIALQFLDENGIFPLERQEELAPLAAQFFTGAPVMEVDWQPVAGQALPAQGGGLQLFTGASLVRGMVALLLFLFSLLCAVGFAQDNASGFFARTAPYVHPARLFFPSYAASTVLAAGAGALGLGIAAAFFPGYFAGPLREGAWLLLYLVYLAAFGFFLASLFRRGGALVAALPFCMTACLLLCPIFMDISPHIPAGRLLASLLPPTLYLRAAAGAAAPLWQMPLASAYLFAAGFGITQLRRLRRPAAA